VKNERQGTKRAHETYLPETVANAPLAQQLCATQNNGHERNRNMELQTLIQGFGEVLVREKNRFGMWLGTSCDTTNIRVKASPAVPTIFM
jgi:hypothetical protein